VHGKPPPAALDAFDAIRQLRDAAIGAVVAWTTGKPSAELNDAMVTLEQALQVGIEWDNHRGRPRGPALNAGPVAFSV
jgi:hypothetical protein